MTEELGLRGERVTLRRVSATDTDRLTAILTAPSVAQWWPGYDADRVRREYTHLDPADADGEMAFMVEVDGEPIGLIQCHEEDEPDYRHAGIDIALHPAWHGRELGPEAIRILAHWLFEVRGITASRSTPPPKTPPQSAPTPRSASVRSGGCASTSAAPTAPGTTAC